MFIPVKISFDDGMCTDSLIALSCTTVWKQYCTMDRLMLTQAFKIGLLSAKSDLSRTNLLQKVRLRTKVRENRTFWEDWCSDVQNRVGTPHIKMCLHVHTRVGTPHMPIGVFDQMFKLGWGHRTRSKMFETTNTMGRVGGWWVTIRRIMPLRGSILQVGTCQILSLAENPRWSRVWQ